MSTAGKFWKHPSVRALVSTEPKVKAELIVPIKGKFTSWRRGQKVLAQKIGRNSYRIERLRWRKPLVPLSNSLSGVPKIALKFL
jgi:hypothetical protein